MNKNNNLLYTLGFKPFSVVFITSSSYFISPATLASNVAVNHSQLEQYVSFQDEEVLLKPVGEGVFLSLDLNEHWSASLDYQTWQDKQQAISPVSIDLSLTSLGGSISYVQDNWYASTSLGFSEDEVSYRANQNSSDSSQETTQVTALSSLVGYNWLNGNWIFDLSMGAQYADWSVKNIMFNAQLAQDDKEPPANISIRKEDSSSINAGISAARYWELTQNQGVLAGVMLSWSYQFSGEAKQTTKNPPPPTRTVRSQPTRGHDISNTTSRATSGDDNYGQITTFVSYDINNNWSVAIDTSIEIASTNNNQSWAVGVNYSF